MRLNNAMALEKPLIGILISLAFVTAAVGGEYNDPSGFSITYPDGWFSVAKFNAQVGKLPQELRNWIAKNNIDLDKISVVVVRSGQDDFLENANVVVTPQEIPINDQSLKELVNGIKQQYRTLGISIDKLEGHEQQVGDNQVIILNFEGSMPAIPFLLRQRQMYLPGDGKSYIVTCTGKADTFATYSPIFDSILASFKTPPSIANGFRWNRPIVIAAICGAIGGAIGGLIAVPKKFGAEKKRTPPPY
jgi:hypothetical protein